MNGVTDLTIHRATLADLEDVLPLVQAYRVFYEQRPNSQQERAFVENHLRHHTSVIYLASFDGRPAGFMQLFKCYSTVHLHGSWILEDIYVDPQFRRGGVGSALLSHALQHVRADGGGGMFLETAHDNMAARAMYERAGWVREGRFIKYNAPLPPTTPQN